MVGRRRVARRAGVILAVLLSSFGLTACHELYCAFIEGLTAQPVDCSHEEFPDLGDIDFPPLPPPPSLPTTTTSLVTSTTSTVVTSTTTTTTTSTTVPDSTATTLPGAGSGASGSVASAFQRPEVSVPDYTIPSFTVPTRTVPSPPAGSAGRAPLAGASGIGFDADQTLDQYSAEPTK